MNRFTKSMIFVFVLGLASLCAAQESGIPTFSLGEAHEVDVINLVTLEPTINVPLVGQSAGPRPFSHSPAGQSHCTIQGTGKQKVVFCGGIPNIEGTSSLLNYSAYYYSSSFQQCSKGNTRIEVNWAINSADGLSRHPIPGMSVDSLDCLTTSPVVGTTNDGSGLTLVLTWNSTYSTWDQTIYSRSGNYVPVTGNGTETEYDPFGNTVSETYQSYGELFTDTIGGTFLSGYSNGSPIYTWKDTTGTQQQISVVKGATQNITMGQCNPGGPSGMTAYPETFNYPDGTSLSFNLEPSTGGTTGRVGSFTLRTGGPVSYTYGTLVCNNSTRLSSLTRTTPDGSTTYTSAAWGVDGLSTTVLDPGKNKTVYEFTNASYVGTANYPPMVAFIIHYQNTGTVSSPVYTQISQDQICYNGICDYGNNLIGTPITQRDVYHTIGTMSTSTHQTEYFDSYGNVTSTVTYGPDFGSSTVYRTTTVIYGTWNGTTCVAIGNRINDKPCQIYTSDAAGNILSYTLNVYTNKGFLSSTQQWTGTQWLITSFSPNSNGTVNTTTTPAGAVSTFGYSCNSLLPSSTSTVVSTGDTLTTGTTWDCNLGKVLGTSDSNTNTTSTTYDAMGRVASYTDQSRYDVSTSYTSNTKVVSDSFDSTVITTTLDSLGRTTRTQSPDYTNDDTTSTSYSWVGPNAVVGSSIPCFEPAGTDCPIVLNKTIDPLGRTLSSVRTSNETVTTVYSQTAATATVTLGPAPSGENTKVVSTTVDALGRPTSISKGAGITDTYTYSTTPVTLGSQVGVSTTTVTRGSQSHTTVKDATGRTIETVTPEAGTTQYIYDNATSTCSGGTSLGHLVETVDNKSSHTCLGVDPLARTTYKWATGDTTGCRTYVFGDNSYTPPSGVSISNGKGRLVAAQLSFGCNSSSDVDEWFSYDKNGRLADVWEKTPHSGGVYYHTTVAYNANGSMSSLSGLPGYAAVTYGYDAYGRSYSFVEDGTAVIDGILYSASGKPTVVDYWNGDYDSYNYDPNTDKMTMYNFTVNSKNDTGTLTWNADGDLGKLVIVDPLLHATDAQTCTFSYDDANRIVTDNCGSTQWNQTFSYDQYDNMKKTGSPGGTWNVSYNSANNQFQGIGATYDADGQLTYDSFNTYTWDNYHKVIGVAAGMSAAVCGTSGVCTTYDALGRPVEYNKAGTITESLYSPVGMLANMTGASTVNYAFIPSPAGGYMWTNTSAGGNRRIQHYDWLGSVRAEVNPSNPPSGDNVISTQAYSAYGERYDYFWNGGGADYFNFTGDRQDMFSGLNDTPNREMSQSVGRWLSPDPAGASWNAYSYPTNPNSQTDPSGAMLCDDGSCGPGTSHSSEEPADKGCDPSNCSSSNPNSPAFHDFDFSTAQDTSTLQKAEEAVDWFNSNLGFGKSNCAGGGSCVDALGMAGTAILTAVVSDGASEEAVLARSETKIANLAKGLAKEGTLEAAEREANGGMKVAKAGGTFFEHAENYVKQHIGGLDRQANHLERFIREHPGLSDSQKERAISAIRFARDSADAARTIITPKDPI